MQNQMHLLQKENKTRSGRSKYVLVEDKRGCRQVGANRGTWQRGGHWQNNFIDGNINQRGQSQQRRDGGSGSHFHQRGGFGSNGQHGGDQHSRGGPYQGGLNHHQFF